MALDSISNYHLSCLTLIHDRALLQEEQVVLNRKPCGQEIYAKKMKVGFFVQSICSVQVLPFPVTHFFPFYPLSLLPSLLQKIVIGKVVGESDNTILEL